MNKHSFISGVFGANCGWLLSLGVILLTNNATIQWYWGIITLILGITNVIATIFYTESFRK